MKQVGEIIKEMLEADHWPFLPPTEWVKRAEAKGILKADDSLGVRRAAYAIFGENLGEPEPTGQLELFLEKERIGIPPTTNL